MQTLVINAEWRSRKGTQAHPRDIKGIRAQQGSRVWTHPQLSIQSSPVPEPGPREVLIETKACGLCGSDVALGNEDSQGYVYYPYMMSSPIVPGHEPSGVVAAVGKGVTNFRVGDFVTAQCVINCFDCSMCKRGRYDECEYNEERGFTVDGACTEYFLADERHVHSLAPLLKCFSDEKLFLAGSVVEPLTGTFKALKENGVYQISPRDREKGTALVVGAGPIGIAAMLNLRAIGFGTILVAEISKYRQEHAIKLGADSIIDTAHESLSDFVLDATDGEGVMVTFEATGALRPKMPDEKQNLWEELIKIFTRQKEQPRLVFFGQSKLDIPINPQLFIQKYAVFTGSHGHTGVWPEVIDLVAEGRIEDPTRMITRTIPLSEAPHWLKRLKQETQELKVTITDFAH